MRTEKDFGLEDTWGEKFLPTPDKYKKSDIQSGALPSEPGREIPPTEITPEMIAASVRARVEVAFQYEQAQRAKDPKYSSNYFAKLFAHAMDKGYISIEEAMKPRDVPITESVVITSTKPTRRGVPNRLAALPA